MMFPDLQLLWQRVDQITVNRELLADDLDRLTMPDSPILGLIRRCLGEAWPVSDEAADFADETADIYEHCLSKPDLLPACCPPERARLIVDVCRVIAASHLEQEGQVVLRALQSIHAIGGADYLAWVRQEVLL